MSIQIISLLLFFNFILVVSLVVAKDETKDKQPPLKPVFGPKKKDINDWTIEMDAKLRKVQFPDKIKHRHPPTKESFLNIDNRINDFLRLLLTEKERALHSGYIQRDLEKLPLFHV